MDVISGYRKRKSQAKALACGTQGRQHSPESTCLLGSLGKGKPFGVFAPRGGGLIENWQVWKKMGKAV